MVQVETNSRSLQSNASADALKVLAWLGDYSRDNSPQASVRQRPPARNLSFSPPIATTPPPSRSSSKQSGPSSMKLESRNLAASEGNPTRTAPPTVQRMSSSARFAGPPPVSVSVSTSKQVPSACPMPPSRHAGKLKGVPAPVAANVPTGVRRTGGSRASSVVGSGSFPSSGDAAISRSPLPGVVAAGSPRSPMISASRSVPARGGAPPGEGAVSATPHALSSVELGNPTQLLKTGLCSYLEGHEPLDALGDLSDLVEIESTSTIGKGHFGEVILAPRRSDGLKLAVKVIPLREAGPSVRREVRTMHELPSHPNLVHLVDVVVCRDQLPQAKCEGPYICIVTQFVENSEPLARVIRRGGAQPNLAFNIVVQLADALLLVHDKGFVHRDVWSENILLSHSGHVVLLDFGASVQHDIGPDINDRLNIPYAAPEASRRARQGPGEDCWALGLLLSEIVTGHFLCDRMGGTNIPAYSQPRVMNELQQETATLAGPHIGKLCKDLLQKDPTSRITMRDVQSYLETTAKPNMVHSASKMLAQTVLESSPVPTAHCLEAPTPPHSRIPFHSVHHVPTPTKSKIAACTHGDSERFKVFGPGTSGRFSLTLKAAEDATTSSRVSLGTLSIAPDDAVASSRISLGVAPKGTGESLNTSNVGPKGTGDGMLDLWTGMRVAYTARSNGAQYPGTIEGRSSDGLAWCLSLDCGELKVVADHDAWRITALT